MRADMSPCRPGPGVMNPAPGFFVPELIPPIHKGDPSA